MTEAPFRLTLRQLPLPAKLVLSCFLIAVGLGYFSAMVQLHLQHSSRQGGALPSVDDVVERFAGLKKADGQPGQSAIECLIAGDRDGDLTSKNMAPAFFAKSNRYETECAERGKPVVDAEREGERQATLAWVRADAAAKKAAYEADAFPLPADLKGRPVTTKFRDGDAVRIQSLVKARCVRCHKAGGDQNPELDTFAKLEPLTTPPLREVLPGGWERSGKQMSVEKLTQSTHAHLLSFAVLFTLTGLTFAFTSYPVAVRCVLAPVVLLAQVTDVACWWLARIDGVGPFFAMAIVATGSAVAAGLIAQIVGSLFNMYDRPGKLVVAAILIAGLAGLGVLFARVLNPALAAEAVAVAKPDEPKAVAVVPPAGRPVSQLERLVAGPRKGAKWDGGPQGSMAAAFFEKSEGFKAELKERPEVEQEREGEQQAVAAWLRLDDAARRKAYEADALPLPADWNGRPITADYLTADKAGVKVKSLLADRCVRCHGKDGDQSDYPLENYEQLLKYLGPEKAKD